MEEGSFSLQVIFLFEEIEVLLLEGGVLGLELTYAEGVVIIGWGVVRWTILLFGGLFYHLLERKALG